MIPSRIQESQNLISLFKEFQSKVGRGKTRTLVQLRPKLKHPRIEFEAINSSGLAALLLKR